MLSKVVSWFRSKKTSAALEKGVAVHQAMAEAPATPPEALKPFEEIVAEGMAEAAAASKNNPEHIYWVKTCNRLFKGQWVTSQWVGYIRGEAVAVVTYDGTRGKRRRRFMAFAMKQYLGHFRKWQEAQDAAGDHAVTVADGVVDMATHLAALLPLPPPMTVDEIEAVQDKVEEFNRKFSSAGRSKTA